MRKIKNFSQAWIDRRFRPTAIRVAVVVGSLLFTINHGSAVWQGKMTSDRWISSFLTYLVPYTVSIHGQFVARSRHNFDRSHKSD
jgi:hypothetical protein